MKDVRLIPYMKKLEHSYAIGVFPVIELLENKTAQVVKVIFQSRGKDNSGVKKIVEICKKNNIRMEWNDGLIKKLGGTDNAYAIAAFMKYKDQVENGVNHVVMANPQDAGNLGTIIRTGLGFGIRNFAIISPGVDVFDPKTVRASMGAVFNANIEYFPNFESYSQKHKNNVYTFMVHGKDELSNIKFKSPFALVFGSESAGLSAEYFSLGTPVHIEQTNDVDSLNLSIAAGVAMYIASK